MTTLIIEPIALAENADFSGIQPGITHAQVRHALVVHPTWQSPEEWIGAARYVLAYGRSGERWGELGLEAGPLLRIRCLAWPGHTLVLSAERASRQEEVEYGDVQEGW